MKGRLPSVITAMVLAVVFMLGFIAGQLTPTVSASNERQTEGNRSHLARFERVWELVHSRYIEQPVDDEALIQGAINGMLESLGDRHTSYMPPEEFEMLNGDLQGSYTGIGALVEAEDNRLLIVSPFDNSPAQEAGLRPGDEIVRVDDTYVSEFEDPLTAVTLVRGPAGEPVTLLIRRGAEEFEVTIVRAVIPLISASGEMLEENIGYVRIADFGEETLPQLRETLSELLAEEPTGLILDLRGNPGGLLDVAISVASEFIAEGDVAIEQTGDGTQISFSVKPGGLATDPSLPLVVLVDGGSASASEIVAAAIQESGRGQLLGETTYGKGTVQQWIDLGPDAGGVRITIARWLTPAGNWIDEQGIAPDVEVEFTEADYAAEFDVQLESAKSLLLDQPLPEHAPAAPRLNKLWKCGPATNEPAHEEQ